MRRVCIETPYAATTEADLERNIQYAQRCMLHSLRQGEAPFLSHLLYTQVLDDTVPELRAQGIEAGHVWLATSDLVAVYTDLTITRGMWDAISYAKQIGKPVIYRTLP